MNWCRSARRLRQPSRAWPLTDWGGARARAHTHTHTIKTPTYQSRSRFQKGEDFCAVQKIRLYQKLNGDNVDHRFLAVQTFKPREFERFGRSEE